MTLGELEPELGIEPGIRAMSIKTLDPMRAAFKSPRAFGFACIVFLLFQLLHYWLIPIVMNYDSFEYIRYADLLGTDKFESEYFFSRPPLYPLLLRISMGIFGRNSFAAMLPSFIFGSSGVLLIAILLRRRNYPVFSIFALGIASLSPDLITNQHTVLTEIGSFFFIAAATFALAFPEKPTWKSALLVATVLGVGYYQRPTLIFFTPLFALIWHMRLHETLPRPSLRISLLQGLMIVVVPFLIAYPWSRIVDTKTGQKDMGKYVIGFGILKGVLLPPNDPVIEPYREKYVQAINDSSPDGRLDAAGLTQSSFVQFQWDFMVSHGNDAHYVLLNAIRKYPERYIASVTRCMLYFMGRDSMDDDNLANARGILGPVAQGSYLTGTDHPNYKREAPYFTQSVERSFLAKVLNRLLVPYKWFLIIGSAFSCVGLVVAVVRKHFILFTFTAIPLCHLLMYSLLMLSVNRYGFPVFPFLIINSCLVPLVLFEERFKVRNQGVIPH